MYDTITTMVSHPTGTRETVSRIHPEIAPVASVQSLPITGEHQVPADISAAMLATGWFAALDAYFPHEVKPHPTLCRSVEVALTDRGSVIYQDGSSIHAVIDLWSGNIDEDPALIEAIRSLREGVLARAVVSLTVYHDSEHPLTAAPVHADRPDLRST